MPAGSELLFVSLHRVVAGKTVMPVIEREQIAVGRLHRSLGIVFDSPFAEHESLERMVAPGGGVEEERVEMIYQKAGLTGLHHVVAEEQTLLGGHPTGKALGDENLEGEVAHLGFVYFVEQLLGELPLVTGCHVFIEETVILLYQEGKRRKTVLLEKRFVIRFRFLHREFHAVEAFPCIILYALLFMEQLRGAADHSLDESEIPDKQTDELRHARRVGSLEETVAADNRRGSRPHVGRR